MSPPDDAKVLGSGKFWAFCPSCEDAIVYRTHDKRRAKQEARDHREWHPDHRPYARGPNGERLYN